MTAIELWLRQPAAQAIGWALLQFVWQGLVVSALTAGALLALRRSAADVRYVVSSIALALMMTLPVVTAVQKYQALRATAALDNAHGVTFRNGVLAEPDGTRILFDRIKVVDPDAAAPPPSAASAGPTASDRLVARMPALLLLWIGGVSILTLRLLTGWIWVQRLRTHGVTAASAAIQSSGSRLAKRLHITRVVTLLESSIIEVPTVIGFIAPVVLLPVSALAGLTPQQIEAILAHELAHIRRHDYLVNLLQTLVETVLFYHPAVWWLSRRIRVERENCCDDLAVSLCGDPVAYATALADLEALRGSGPLPVRHIAMAATGGSLLQRVRRLLGAPSSHSGRAPAWLAGLVALLLVGGIAAGADAGRQDRVAAAPAAPSTPAVPSAEPAAPVEAVPASAAAPPAMAAPSAMPAPPAMPTPAAQSVSVSQSTSDSHGSWSYTNNSDHLEVTYSGAFEFTDDDTDVRQLSAGGSLKISDGRWLFGRHSVEIRERDGKLEHHYYVNASERPFEPEGRAWLRDNLPRFVRNSGFGAEARVARFLKNGGPGAVLTEIGRLDSTYVKRIYFTQLFKQASLTPEQYRQALSQAGREMRGSNYELAQLLIGLADGVPDDEATKAAYFQAASGIHSDYELRRVLSAMIKRGPLSSSTLAGVLASARSIDSDYEASELLRLVLAQQTIDEHSRDAFFAAVATLDSAYERHRVLSAVVQHPVDAATLAAALTAAARNSSDYETSTFLQEALRANNIEPVRAAFFTAVNTLGSGYERSRVLQAVVRKPGTSDDTLRAVLQSSRALSGYDLSQLLQLVARSYPLTGDLRDGYVTAANRLGDYEQTQALAALVKSERRK
jgi:beta-lactamase regulating signal transducer with metallopeptidase domain